MLLFGDHFPNDHYVFIFQRTDRRYCPRGVQNGSLGFNTVEDKSSLVGFRFPTAANLRLKSLRNPCFQLPISRRFGDFSWESASSFTLDTNDGCENMCNRAGSMAWLWKSLLCKHEDLSLEPWHQRPQSWYWGSGGRWIPGAHQPASLAKSVSSRSVRDSVSENKRIEWGKEQVSTFGLHTHAFTHVCTSTHHIHTYVLCIRSIQTQTKVMPLY